MTEKRKLRLGAFLMSSGHHVASWRYPDARADGGLSFDHFRKIAQTAERGKFDMIFFADGVSVRDRGQGTEVISRAGHVAHFEPLTLLSALSVVTERIGLVATVSTTYNEPFHLARKFASLDYLSGGRAAWNLVTSASDSEAKNFNLEKPFVHLARQLLKDDTVDTFSPTEILPELVSLFVRQGTASMTDNHWRLLSILFGPEYDYESYHHNEKYFVAKHLLCVAQTTVADPIERLDHVIAGLMAL